MPKQLKPVENYREARSCANCAHGSARQKEVRAGKVYCQRDRENSLMWIARTGYMVCDGHKRVRDA